MTETIRDLIKKSGKTLEELAELAGLDAGYLSRVQNGKRNLGTAGRGQLAGALKISAARLADAEAATLAAATDPTLNVNPPLGSEGDSARADKIELQQSEVRGPMIHAMRKRLVMEILDLPDEFIPAADKVLQGIRLMVASDRPTKGKQTS